ncbi:MAG TPA: twin-arginine translocase TatA/TatE family subunit [Chloroflexota bacterium]|nr:twin-arginine translocase TatA/TatE family subunit [Chloroflexota bacterium]
MFGLGPFEIILIVVIFIIFFGAGRLGDLGGALGRGIKEFRKNAALDSPSQEEKPKDRSA